KIKMIHHASIAEHIFPWQKELSTEIELHPFALSFLLQPLFYLRIRPGRENKVEKALKQNEIPYERIGEHGIALQNSVRADAVLTIDEDAIVQDINSQKVLQPLINEVPLTISIKVWDCCAASGGKSILAVDTFKNVNLTVSDVRKSILQNLKNRFSRAGLHHYHSFIADAATIKLTRGTIFDVIICDAPCSGSGTWSRTPEQLYYFEENKIEYYSTLQKSIVKNVSRYLTKNGFFVYITCSVFKKENEEVVSFIEKETNLKTMSTTYLKGYTSKADTLFVALFSNL
ncbi:MAG TPA: methyltransferase domain-containing protein, partial [Chitinophagaceae bacterium]|nr:methyltransferase domain-containing protein [Chitinophagaceae bacterium]